VSGSRPLAASPIRDLSQRSADAYLDYLRAVGGLTTEYVRGVVDLARGRRSELRMRPRSLEPQPTREDPATPSDASLVLEGASGTAALGAFVVENALDRPVEATFAASALTAPDGRQIEAAVVFEPPGLELDQGEQAVVQVAIGVDDAMPDGADLRGELRVPGLSGTTIPVVVRRVGP
jgi:hypothetical protein